MIRGTTPTHIFTLPFDTSPINKIRVLYSQKSNVLLTKDETECVAESNSIKTTLTQEETFLFDAKIPVEIQLRILTKDGNALASVVTTVGVSRLLETEVFE